MTRVTLQGGRGGRSSMQGRFAVSLPPTTPRTCVVCAKPLDWRTPLTPRKGLRASSSELYAICRELSCRWVFDQVWDVPEAQFKQQLQWHAQRWRDWCVKRREEEEERDRLRRAQMEVEAREDAAAFAALRARPGLGQPALELVTPTGRGPSRPLSKRRRQAYAAYLDRLIADAFNPVQPPAPNVSVTVGPPPGPELGATGSQLPGRLCGTCGGGCCAWGSNEAYLSRATIRRVMAANPGLDAQQMRALYLDHLAPRTVANSCINHTRHGCSLPKDLRSDICNRYACAALRSLHGGLEADPPVGKVLVLRRRQNRWNQENPRLNNDIVGAAVLTETTTTQLRPPAIPPLAAAMAEGESERP